MTLARRIFTEKRRYIYPLIGALVLNAVLLAVVVYPLSKKVAAGEQQAQSANLALTSARRDHAAARATVSGKDSADVELKKFYSAVLPPDYSAARRLTFGKIDDLLRASNLSRTNSTSKQSQERDSELGKLTMNLSLTGQYRNIRQFIYALETTPDFLILENVKLAQGSEGSGALNVTVQVATYYRTGSDGH